MESKEQKGSVNANVAATQTLKLLPREGADIRSPNCYLNERAGVRVIYNRCFKKCIAAAKLP